MNAADPLAEYRRKRDPQATPEPVPAAGALPTGTSSDRKGNAFVIQEHHARALHWDFRLERGGVLVSWALPKGLPTDPKRNHLAVPTEDHPLEYASFEGGIPAREYGGGSVTIWDRGSYVTEEWTDDKVKVRLLGSRAQGRFVLFRTDAKSWMIHRMDALAEGGEPLPALVPAMLATPAQRPPEEEGWSYEMKWDGIRAIAYVDGGRVRLLSRNERDVSGSYPEIRGLGEQLGSTQAVLDGELVAFDDGLRPSFARLQQRMGVTSDAQARRLVASYPVVYVIFDLLHLDGRSTLGLPYVERRELLEGLGLSGRSWQTPPTLGEDGAAVLDVTKAQGLEGVVGKRRVSTYQPGRRSPDWLKIKNVRDQEVAIGGWHPGKGRRSDTIGALLVGIPSAAGLDYAGKVGTGFSDAVLRQLAAQLAGLVQKECPFVDVPGKDAKDAVWCTPRLVGEVAFTQWTTDGRLRHPSWRGLRPDKDVDDVRRVEAPEVSSKPDKGTGAR